MKVEVKTTIWHELNADGTPREDHCCGCWNVCLDEDMPEVPYAQCNECGELRYAVLPGVEQPSRKHLAAPVATEKGK